jgi:hypothetical protein
MMSGDYPTAGNSIFVMACNMFCDDLQHGFISPCISSFLSEESLMNDRFLEKSADDQGH